MFILWVNVDKPKSFYYNTKCLKIASPDVLIFKIAGAKALISTRAKYTLAFFVGHLFIIVKF